MKNKISIFVIVILSTVSCKEEIRLDEISCKNESGFFLKSKIEFNNIVLEFSDKCYMFENNECKNFKIIDFDLKDTIENTLVYTVGNKLIANFIKKDSLFYFSRCSIDYYGKTRDKSFLFIHKIRISDADTIVTLKIQPNSKSNFEYFIDLKKNEVLNIWKVKNDSLYNE